jgi:hypothetical protein
MQQGSAHNTAVTTHLPLYLSPTAATEKAKDKTRPDPLQTVKQERVLPWSLSRTINQEAIKDRRPCLPMKVTFHLQSCKRQNIMNGVDVVTSADKC